LCVIVSSAPEAELVVVEPGAAAPIVSAVDDDGVAVAGAAIPPAAVSPVAAFLSLLLHAATLMASATPTTVMRSMEILHD
jgi:hypothetical protein